MSFSEGGTFSTNVTEHTGGTQRHLSYLGLHALLVSSSTRLVSLVDILNYSPATLISTKLPSLPPNGGKCSREETMNHKKNITTMKSKPRSESSVFEKEVKIHSLPHNLGCTYSFFQNCQQENITLDNGWQRAKLLRRSGALVNVWGL
jgi:hypothetical protein